ncbi:MULTISPECIES: zinc-dependent peptidase [unclassified Vibrio]|uniref:zinc-dependent peptidase n=1 Tax=unclassified Vibrio TaxID=2614977 RepID=UPI000D3BE4CD|nr:MULTISPECIES: zinc-dependent peptidase [unclassified Vibrio]PTP03552.1 hypothetical protein CWO17_13355 [Vibrio sp. 10N.286.45.A3]PTQ23542.1 hypothetical protein CWO24_12555 [Vibrio sp. 10N.286.46.E10]TKE76797.1 hypothetical protein FCV56_19725 [Vibrio sp. F12]TKE96921.1 hypothetical protein FCV61_14500 [Vibrio sp. F12]
MFLGKSRNKKTKKQFENVHDILLSSMALYPYFSVDQQLFICHFVNEFYNNKTVLVSPDITIENQELLLVLIAANASLVGGAQRTNYFSSVKWVHICSDDLQVDGDAYETSTVRLNAFPCLKESSDIIDGRNLIVHEFAHILDHIYGLSGSTPALRKGYEVYLGNTAVQQEYLVPDCATSPSEIADHIFTHDDTLLRTHEEYFAVLSELFFTNPAAIHENSLELYSDLVGIYGLNMVDILSVREQVV